MDCHYDHHFWALRISHQCSFTELLSCFHWWVMLLQDAHFSLFVFRINLWASVFLASVSCSSAKQDLSMLSWILSNHAAYQGNLNGGSRLLCSSLGLKRIGLSILYRPEEAMTIFAGQMLCLEILARLWKRWDSLTHHHPTQFKAELPQLDCSPTLRVVFNFWRIDSN